MGRHSAPSQTGKRIVRVASATLVGAASATLLPGTAQAAPSTDSILNAIAFCESGGRNIPTGIVGRNGQRISTAGGFFQIVNGTWRAHGGTQFAATALQATYAEQLIVARRILTEGQGIGAWSESKSCWSKKIGTVGAPKVEEPKPKPIVSAPKTIKKQVTSPPVVHSTAKKVAASYVIKRGDTLVKIAVRNHTTWRNLYNLNRGTVKNPNRIYVGNTLRLR